MVDHRGLSKRAAHAERQHDLHRLSLGESLPGLLLREHFINPVIYVEYEDINNADKTFLEITGHHSIQDLWVPNDVLRQTVERSIETKLILSSNIRGVELPSENFIAEKESEK